MGNESKDTSASRRRFLKQTAAAAAGTAVAGSAGCLDLFGLGVGDPAEFQVGRSLIDKRSMLRIRTSLSDGEFRAQIGHAEGST